MVLVRYCYWKEMWTLFPLFHSKRKGTLGGVFWGFFCFVFCVFFEVVVGWVQGQDVITKRLCQLHILHWSWFFHRDLLMITSRQGVHKHAFLKSRWLSFSNDMIYDNYYDNKLHNYHISLGCMPITVCTSSYLLPVHVHCVLKIKSTWTTLHACVDYRAHHL